MWRRGGAVLAGAGLLALTTACGTPSAEPGSAAPSRSASSELDRFRANRVHVETAEPVRVRIPVIGVTSGLERLGRAADRSVEVPQDPQSAGWYAEGPRPGEVGPAVLLGHVDSRLGPAVFFRLRELVPGDEVLVDRADGTTARFVVSRLQQVPKDTFPTELVYYPTTQAELRLVTCGGTFDRRTGHYRDNVIVFAGQSGS